MFENLRGPPPPDFGVILSHRPLHVSQRYDFDNKSYLLNVHAHVHSDTCRTRLLTLTPVLKTSDEANPTGSSDCLLERSILMGAFFILSVFLIVFALYGIIERLYLGGNK